VYGEFVRGVRRSRRLSQRQLATISGVGQTNISAIENDRRIPSADTLNRLLVSCGYELAAVAGEHVITCPIPLGTWFPDEMVPPRLPGDPPDERPAVDPLSTIAERARVVAAMLDSVDAVISRR